MLLGKPKSAWPTLAVAKRLRMRERAIRMQLLTKPRFLQSLPVLAPDPTFLVLQLRVWASIYCQEATDLSQSPAVKNDEEVRECFASIDRDFTLFEIVATRENAVWSVYQREEMDAIVERIARNYARAADRLDPVAP